MSTCRMLGLPRGVLCLALVFLTVSPAAAADDAAGAWFFSPAQLRPFWLSTTMQGESVLFIQAADGSRPRAALLVPPTRILSVCSSSGEVTYQEGQDYVWKPGTQEIVLPPGSAICFKRPQDLRRPAKSQRFVLTHRDGNGEILFGGGHEYHDMQTDGHLRACARRVDGPSTDVRRRAIAPHDREAYGASGP